MQNDSACYSCGSVFRLRDMTGLWQRVYWSHSYYNAVSHSFWPPCPLFVQVNHQEPLQTVLQFVPKAMTSRAGPQRLQICAPPTGQIPTVSRSLKRLLTSWSPIPAAAAPSADVKTFFLLIGEKGCTKTLSIRRSFLLSELLKCLRCVCSSIGFNIFPQHHPLMFVEVHTY